ncbi:TLD domain-containing protein 2-like isoform X1 [Oryzias latipes]|uniref:TLD domain-containing protein 2-like isoform X1 n=1 Tax=Oryzias latipes TaxID=8090 RepID=UPI0005CBE24C|nr:TLD domain-containing protein 2-like isoform X1 [Oryzias latipes]
MGVAYSVGEVDHLYPFFMKKHCRAQHFRKKYKNRFFADKNVINGLFSQLNNNLKAANNWEFITVKQAKQHISLCNLEDFEKEEQEFQEVENELPVLSDQSLLLEDHHLKTLVTHLPPRTQGYRWNLVYSTAIHGSSLKTLYRNMAGLDSPVLLVIKDMHKKVFGAFSSDPFRISKYCYGTGETFLFTFSPDFQQYKWSGENSYFVSGDLGSLQIGGGGGGFALWLDADLYHGASFSSSTFHNATLSTHEDFIVQDAEVWTVQN